MNFRPELAEAVMAGRKWVTRRLVSDNPRSPYHPDRALKMEGKRVAICPGRGKPRIGNASVVAIRREQFDPDNINHVEAMAEGFYLPDDFRATWLHINGNLKPVEVWRIKLDAITDEREAI